MSWFTEAMKDLASRKGARKMKTVIRRKTEDGTITVTVTGSVATNEDHLKELAEAMGAAIAGKGGSFRAAEGSQSASLVDEDASDFTDKVCDPNSYSTKKPAKKKKDKDDDHKDTADDTKLEGAGV